MKKHKIKRRKRRGVYISIATAALLVALLGVLTADVTRSAEGIATSGYSTFLNTNERDIWSAVAVMVDGEAATRKSWLESNVDSRELSSPFVTLTAIVYKSIKALFHFSLAKEPAATTRIVMALINLPLLAVFFASMIACIEKVGVTNWSRYSSTVIICFATMLLPLTASLNFQLPAAAATALTLWLYIYLADRIENHYVLSPRFWTAAGFVAAMAGAFHFSAALMVVPWLLLFARLDIEEIKPLLGGAGLGLAFFVCSVAMGIVRGDQVTFDAVMMTADPIVAGSTPRVFHAFAGHHGLFSLGPIWLMLPFACFRAIRFETQDFQWLATGVAAISLLGLLLGIGMTVFGHGSQLYLGHLTWMTPLWVLMITPFMESLERSRVCKAVVIVLVGISVLSAIAAFPSLTATPWIYHLWPVS